MALTTIKSPTGALQIETIEGDNGIIIHWFLCDENLQKTGESSATADSRTEEEFHRELRIAAAEKKQLITSHSTNPEWNPEGYVNNIE